LSLNQYCLSNSMFDYVHSLNHFQMKMVLRNLWIFYFQKSMSRFMINWKHLFLLHLYTTISNLFLVFYLGCIVDDFFIITHNNINWAIHPMVELTYIYYQFLASGFISNCFKSDIQIHTYQLLMAHAKIHFL
jgi:hypothetical protein